MPASSVDAKLHAALLLVIQQADKRADNDDQATRVSVAAFQYSLRSEGWQHPQEALSVARGLQHQAVLDGRQQQPATRNQQ